MSSPFTHPLLALALLTSCTAPTSDPGGPPTEVTDSSTSAVDPGSTATTAIPTTAPEPTTTGDESDPSTTDPGTSTTLDPAAMTTGGETTGTPPGCGDGEISPDEECDFGHGNNYNGGECSLNCQLAVCGDGQVWEGVEQCDAGPDNSLEYGGCTPQCVLGPHCGDGSIQANEECDLGVHNGTGEKAALDGVPCSDTCRHVGLIVFLSSATYSVVQLLSSNGADARCQELAQSAGLNNATHFKAWISDGWGSVNDRFSPAVAGMPYVLPSGLRVADDRAQLFASGPLTGITGTELGETLLKARVWTATTPGGALLDDDLDCYEWTKDSILLKGGVGRSGVDKQDLAEWQTWKSEMQWTTHATLSCGNTYHLYCFEQ